MDSSNNIDGMQRWKKSVYEALSFKGSYVARQIEKGELALYKYNKIRFSFVALDAGEQQVLTSDPWSFLSSHLQIRLNKSRGSNREKIERGYLLLEPCRRFLSRS